MSLFDDRLALARTVTDHLLADYGDVIVAVGLHGSMAHRVSDERSDLDFAILTREAEDLRGRDIFFNGVLLSLSTAGVDEYLSEAAEVDDAWSIESDQFVHTLALHDPDGVFDRSRDAQERATHAELDDFLDRARENVVGATEAVSKAERSLDHGSQVAASICVSDALVSLAQSVGLLARIRWRGRHTAAAQAADAGRFIDGFSAAYAEAWTGELGTRIAAIRRAIGAIESHLAIRGVTSDVDSLNALLG